MRFIQWRIDTMGLPPTLRELGEHLGIRSTNGVNDHLKRLEKKGYIQRDKLKARSITLIRRLDSDPVLGWSLSGPLGSLIHVWVGVRLDSVGDLARQIEVTVHTRSGTTSGRLVETRTIPVTDTTHEVAIQVHAMAMRLLGHELLESIRYRGSVLFDAHPDGAGRDGVCMPSDARLVHGQ